MTASAEATEMATIAARAAAAKLADNVVGHGSVVMNETVAERLGIADGDLVEVRSPLNATRGQVVLCQGIRPDTLLIIGQFEQWVTPYPRTSMRRA